LGPLNGLKIVEFAGIGPGPFASMLLADLGAQVIRLDRKEPSQLGLRRSSEFDFGLRNRKAVRIDLKDPRGVELAARIVDGADALIEGFRPGVMERLGLGPQVCLERNPRLVYGRITGWGQAGPLASAAGHDLNYIAITGALHAIGRAGGPPVFPINLLGDYAGGSLYLVMGLLSALLEAKASGRGQVVDAAIVDGVASLSTHMHGMLRTGIMSHERGTNIIDSGSHFYDVYECADGKWITFASVEPKFYDIMLRLLDIELDTRQLDVAGWAQAKVRIAQRIKTRTRDEWTSLFEGTDACFAPVLDLDEATQHPHLKSRETYLEVDGEVQPAPAPRFSRSQPAPPVRGETADSPQAVLAALRGWLPDKEAEAAVGAGVV
jgi:alpha-methylacyl-CoA racemase